MASIAFGCAVRREPHHLVLVAIVGKAEILGQRLIEDAERMREIDAAVDTDVAALARSPGGAGEIAEAVDRDDHRLVERRDVKGRGEMREVMLDVMHLAAKLLAGKALLQKLGDALTRAPVLEAVEHQSETRALHEDVAKLPSKGWRGCPG